VDKKSFISYGINQNTIVRSCYVNNPHPFYQPPKTNTNKPPAIKAIVNAARTNNPARHEAWYTIPRISKKTKLVKPFYKRMNEHRARAINALMVGIADRLNIISGKVEASIEQFSDWCGLSTGNNIKKSISRASRALITLEELDALSCERIWDSTSHSYIPKIIWVKELFFVLIGYELGKYRAIQNQQLAWINQGLTKKGEAPISLSEARRRARKQHIKRAFEYRLRRRAFKQQQKQALKIMKMTPEQARHKILNDLIKLYSSKELQKMGYKELRRQVDQRYYILRKLAISVLGNIP